jgi:hypothetical protein
MNIVFKKIEDFNINNIYFFDKINVFVLKKGCPIGGCRLVVSLQS